MVSLIENSASRLGAVSRQKTYGRGSEDAGKTLYLSLRIHVPTPTSVVQRMLFSPCV